MMCPQLASDIKKWSFKLDLVQMVDLLLLGTADEIRDHQETMTTRDYYEESIHGVEIKRLIGLNPQDALARVKASIVSIPHSKRSASLQSLVEVRLGDAVAVTPKAMEKTVFLTLMHKYQSALQTGECHREEFALASQVLWTWKLALCNHFFLLARCS